MPRNQYLVLHDCQLDKRALPHAVEGLNTSAPRPHVVSEERKSLDAGAERLLAMVGSQLDQLVFPVVKNGGFVLPRDTAVFLEPLGKENSNELERTSGSAAESWAWTGRRQGTAGGRESASRSRSPGASPPLVGPYQGNGFLTGIGAVLTAYPGTQIWEEADGFWLYAESHLLPGLKRPAGFLVGVSRVNKRVRAWAFWSAGVVGVSWIGPRHTNFPDGSICAFEPADGTWVFGQPLVTLLDIYSVWALRHLHLEVLGHWPGPQSVHFPYERILEVADYEHCPCGFTGRRYAECCQPADQNANRLAIAVSLVCISGVSLRSPPSAVRKFILDRKTVPSIAALV